MKSFELFILKNLRCVSFYSLFRASRWSCEGIILETISFRFIILDYLIFLVIVLINIAFITLFERKILGYSQRRLGPNKPSFAGLLQPMADAVKLFLKTHFSPGTTHKFIFFIGPRISLMLVFWVWLTAPFKFDSSFFAYSAILIIIVIRINVYPLLLIGWASNNKYSILGGLRRVAQTISYEISLALIVITVLILIRGLRLDFLAKAKTFYRILIISPVIFLFWVISRVAETNRTPFDFSEGERELVSGFNTEYGAGGFALIFIAEYGRIYFLRIITSYLFCPRTRFVIIRIFARIIIFAWVWLRRTFPRYRYDLLINLAWKRILPITLALNVIILAVILL